MRDAFEHKQVGGNAGSSELGVGAHGVAQEQVTGSRDQKGGRETGEVSIDGRDQGVGEVVDAGIEAGRSGENPVVPDESRSTPSLV